MRQRVFYASTVVLALGLVGCGGSDSVAITNVEEAYTGAICEVIRNCPGVASEIAVIINAFESQTAAKCEDALSALGELGTPSEVQGVNEGTIDFDGAAAKRCLDAIGSTCAGFEGFGAIDDCKSIFSGTLAIGATCRASAECEGNAYCANDNQCAGTCTARVSTGSPCTSSDACIPDPGASASCNITADNIVPHCVQVKLETGRAAGSPCGDVDEDGDQQVTATCAPGLFCRLAGDTDAGTCATPIAVGLPCTDDDVCVNGFCGSEDICVVPTIQKTVGATCSLEDAIICDATHQLTCSPGGTCVSVGDGSVGSVCATENDATLLPLFSCQGGLFCDQTETGATCQAHKANGAVCTSDRACSSGYCSEAGVCADKPICEPQGL